MQLQPLGETLQCDVFVYKLVCTVSVAILCLQATEMVAKNNSIWGTEVRRTVLQLRKNNNVLREEREYQPLNTDSEISEVLSTTVR